MKRSASHRAARLLLAAGLLCALAFALWRVDAFNTRGSAELARALTQRGRVAVVGSSAGLGARVEGTTFVDSAELPAIAAALRGRDPLALAEAMDANGVAAVLVRPSAAPEAGDTVLGSLARYRRLQGLRGLYLSRSAALYAPDPIAQLPKAHREATAVVARGIVSGARPPKPSSFPASLRAVRPVEVMVLLRRGERARLWRSARGSSIASALVTAAVVARQRWQEREQAMGGPLNELLPRMDVEVALLEDDGTIGEREPVFIDRAFTPEHGVGYERKGAWRYLLPEATALEGKGRASRAYRKLFKDDGLPEDSFDRNELRLYRLLVQQLAVSKAEAEPSDGVSRVRAPDEVLVAPPN